jgi:hypothetical protein
MEYANMAKLVLPSAVRSPTAVPGKSDMRDENIYSAVVVAHGGSTQNKVFTVPQGQNIPQIRGAAIAPAQPHHLVHSDLTTNITQAGQLGSGIGDCSFRAIGITIENAPYPAAAGAGGVASLGAYGAGPTEMAEILNKTAFEFKVGGKSQSKGAAFMYPSVGGLWGSFTTTGAATSAGITQNGWPGNPRRLKIPILAGRTDVLEGILSLGNGASYVFSTTAGAGQETLIWVVLLTLVKGDVR